jgi:hypothetical protein
MERIEVSATNINLFELAHRVSLNRISVELAEGEVPLALIVPVEKPHSMTELDRALRNCVRLEEDAESFAQDVLSVRQSLGELDDPWAS